MAFFGGNAGAQAGPSAAANANNQGDLSKDIELTAPPEDSVSDISFSSQSEHLAVASWDKKVRIYEISATGSSIGKAVYEHEGPVLSVVWSKVGVLFPLIFLPQKIYTDERYRMDPRFFPGVRTRRHVCLIFSPGQVPKSLFTTSLSEPFASSSHRTQQRCWLQDLGIKL